MIHRPCDLVYVPSAKCLKAVKNRFFSHLISMKKCYEHRAVFAFMRNYTVITFLVIVISKPAPFILVFGALELSFFFGSCALFPAAILIISCRGVKFNSKNSYNDSFLPSIPV